MSIETKEKAAPGKDTAKNNNHTNITMIGFRQQELHEIEKSLEEMDHKIQELFRFGTAHNRDIFAMKLANEVRRIRDQLNSGRLM
ncbi:hypothetical protein [Sediminispirochaeta smaragdinae]|uniref:Uncharacterized protein n=1 Tax=Sediminispirochaeta smaragdinae (strain DSM 11293 / JCM 15392 / SEBR 4228) TaxID=573413 RepID=E1R204_SEDSS|nr:hypothetical protein [Sediminispirochaeta smaragdinae]ADK81889.1 hypothetical protein Spirs_2786 [Sediminispirochaeta smaragdinae DSM 11293]